LTAATGCDPFPDFSSACENNDPDAHWAQQPRCEAEGQAKVTAPASLGIGATAPLTFGSTCLGESGGCTSTAVLTFDSFGTSNESPAAAHPRMQVQLFLPPVEGTASYTVAAVTGADAVSGAQVNALLDRGQPTRDGLPWETLEVLSGTITASSTPAAIRVSFMIDLRDPATGATISLSANESEATCELERVCVIEGGWFGNH
jgi:hypothetical protein